MAIPAGSVLDGELHCLSEDGLVVLTVQRWRDLDTPDGRSRTWLRQVRNGRPRRDDHRFTGDRGHRELEIIWARLAERYAPTGLVEDQMWVKLRELAGVEQTRCLGKDCAGRMPTGWPVCPACGRHAGRVSSGSRSGTRRRREIIVPARPDTPAS